MLIGYVASTVAITGLSNSFFNLSNSNTNLIVKSIIIIKDNRLNNNCSDEEYGCNKFPNATEPNAKPEIGVGKLLIIVIIAPNNFLIFNCIRLKMKNQYKIPYT